MFLVHLMYIDFTHCFPYRAKSKNVRNKAVKCSSILKAMIDLHEDDGSYETMPNIICYNTVLNACAFSAHGGEDEKRQALAVAVETFNQMRQGKYVSPDAVTYGDMLKCCANLMPPGNQRNAMASRLFASSRRPACRTGQRDDAAAHRRRLRCADRLPAQLRSEVGTQ